MAHANCYVCTVATASTSFAGKPICGECLDLIITLAPVPHVEASPIALSIDRALVDAVTLADAGLDFLGINEAPRQPSAEERLTLHRIGRQLARINGGRA